MNFVLFKQAVAKQFAEMRNYPLYRTDAPKDGLWQTYLSSFPEGTNPLYKERTEHDCQCCKQFIRAVGNVVAIKDGQLITIWDGTVADRAYAVVTKTMGEYVRSFPINNLFFHDKPQAGMDKNFQEMLDGVIKTWNHFHVTIPPNLVNHNAGPLLGDARAKHDVFKRAMDELQPSAFEVVEELIAQNTLYKGAEYLHIVQGLAKCQLAYRELPTEQKDIFCWEAVKDVPAAVLMGRNSSIGTLLVDLSEGRDLESAVKLYEQKVAPSNYKRPTALVTPRMVEEARKTIEGLGLLSALERRYAVLEDITVNNVLFADRSARKAMGGDVFADLAAAVSAPLPSLDKVEEIGIDKFLADVLPKIQSIEALVENTHAGNFVSLIAPQDPTALPLFKWDNKFSWSYAGEMTDSMRERVKAAGGNVTGELCCRLAWDYSDDLDFHMIEPGGGHIYYGYRRMRSSNGGMLDVDANGADGLREHPVENIFYERVSSMKPGTYELRVNNYRRRSNGAGFEVEIDLFGHITHLRYPKVLRQNDWVTVAYIHMGKDGTVSFAPTTEVEVGSVSKDIWQISTETFRPVNVVMLSPNYWDDQGVGNKHYFFMLDGCANDGQARGFYNEFLKADLDQHRKVLEMLGSKLKTAPAAQQLSGLGFSSTQRNHLVVRVKGSFTRMLKIVF